MILYCLAKNPEKQRKLRLEIWKILPDKNTPLTVEKLTNTPYLQAVIKEGLRMFPVFSGVARKTGQDLILQGYQVPKGVQTSYSQYSTSKYFMGLNSHYVENRLYNLSAQNTIFF